SSCCPFCAHSCCVSEFLCVTMRGLFFDISLRSEHLQNIYFWAPWVSPTVWIAGFCVSEFFVAVVVKKAPGVFWAFVALRRGDQGQACCSTFGRVLPAVRRL